MLTRNRLLAGAAALAAASFVVPAFAQEPIKIGELNSYKNFAAFLEPYKKGWELAVEEVNAAGGVLDPQMILAMKFTIKVRAGARYCGCARARS